jgi:hypothetical protein
MSVDNNRHYQEMRDSLPEEQDTAKPYIADDNTSLYELSETTSVGRNSAKPSSSFLRIKRDFLEQADGMLGMH